MNETQKRLLEHVSAALFQVPVTDPVTEDEIQEANVHAVVGLLPLGSDKLLLQLVAQNVNIQYMHTWIHEVMSSTGIPYCVLKGVTSAAYYPEPMLRTLGDVDFIVRKEDLDRADKVMEQAGCTWERYLHDHHHAFHKDGVTFELHWEAPGVPEDKPEIRAQLSDLIDRAELKDGCMQASAFHHGLILLLHTGEHMINTGIGLRHLCDWAVFAASFSDEEFRDLFEEKLKDAGLWRFAQLLSLTSAKFLSAPKLPWMGEAEDELLDGIMEDGLDAGNFGVKDDERINQAKFLTDRSSRTVKQTGALRQFTKTMTEKALFEWPPCRKHKILLPVGWAVISVRHIARVRRGERPKMHLKNMLAGAQKRKKIYQEFRLFSDRSEE